MTLKLFSTREAEFLRRLFVAYIRPMLEYASPVWSPLTVSASALLERVQRRYTKRVRGLTHLPYDQRLQLLRLETLAQRRTVSDMVLTYKSLRGLTSVLPAALGLQVSSAPTRSCGLKLETLRPSNKLLSNCFQCRAAKQWNSLPTNVLTCRTVNVFRTSTIGHLSSISKK
jgi:ribonuclease P/MRP protein subunit RPP40